MNVFSSSKFKISPGYIEYIGPSYVLNISAPLY